MMTAGELYNIFRASLVGQKTLEKGSDWSQVGRDCQQAWETVASYVRAMLETSLTANPWPSESIEGMLWEIRQFIRTKPYRSPELTKLQLEQKIVDDARRWWKVCDWFHQGARKTSNELWEFIVKEMKESQKESGS